MSPIGPIRSQPHNTPIRPNADTPTRPLLASLLELSASRRVKHRDHWAVYVTSKLFVRDPSKAAEKLLTRIWSQGLDGREG